MTDRQRGLGRRLAFEGRGITSQHRQLHVLVSEVETALVGKRSEAAVRALDQLDHGMRAHFELEERMHFPALHGADAALLRQLDHLVEEHRAFEAELERIRRVTAAGALDVAGMHFAAWTEGVSAHEALEESLYPPDHAERPRTTRKR